MSSPYSYLTPLDFYYLAVSTNIFLYGYLFVMIIGFIGNISQIMTFSRKTMRNVSTGILFLVLSISDTMYLLLCLYVLIIYGFQISDRSNYAKTCQFRHFISYFSTNFSAWMLTTIACDRWIRTQFPYKAQGLCTPRTAVYCIITALIFDCLLHVHLLTPMFGQIAPGITTTCGANILYPTYSYFYTEFWPIITTLTVTIIPASFMIFFVVAIAINVKHSQNRIAANQQINTNLHERRRARFLHRQMLILMFAALILFFFTTFPVAIFRFSMSTLNIQTSFSFSLLLAAIFGFITTLNYSLNFYLHSLTSKLFRKEFLKIFPCKISIQIRHRNQPTNITTNQRQLIRQQQGTITQLLGQLSNTHGLEKNCVTTV